MTRTLILSMIAGGALALGGCAHNYGGEGALGGAGAGAVISGVAGGNVVTGAAIGAAAGALIGSTVHKNDGYCYRHDRDGNEHRVDC
ncbi:hypothetical protein [Novosphingobium terrae]|uniref:hypothetical protein n=1 Tax=Novosphingobium terrae TaxID=2726189 RepID=UPI00197E2FE8|nr:hypothetical protein [Novosphingobium terrae]